MKRLLPVILAVLGLAAGTGAGLLLKPPAVEPAPTSGGSGGALTSGVDSKKSMRGKPTGGNTPAKINGQQEQTGAAAAAAPNKAVEYVKLNNQFVVPIIEQGKVAALVVMSLTIEINKGKSAVVYNLEPKLRDAFLQVLFNHANSGGFSGEFTSGAKMKDLRSALLEAATRILGPLASRVLVTEIVRQDI